MNNTDAEKNHLDLSSFPLLMIHEVPRHEGNTLEKAASELVQMAMDETSPLHGFAAKLLKTIRLELERRIAEARIAAMLSGSMDETGTSVPLPPSDTAAPGLDEIYKAEHAKSLSETAPGGQIARTRSSSFRVPLPSELKRSQSAQGGRAMEEVRESDARSERRDRVRGAKRRSGANTLATRFARLQPRQI